MKVSHPRRADGSRETHAFLVMAGLGLDAQMAANADVSPWVAAAVGYQKLYTRDTVAYTQQDPEAAAKAVRDIRSDDRLALRVPDLTSAGLTFKSVQRLRFNNKPLVQIVYLPQNGPPIALCVMKEVKPDAAVADQKVASMTVVTWRQAELGQLVAVPAVASVDAVADAGGQIPPLGEGGFVLPRRPIDLGLQPLPPLPDS